MTNFAKIDVQEHFQTSKITVSSCIHFLHTRNYNLLKTTEEFQNETSTADFKGTITNDNNHSVQTTQNECRKLYVFHVVIKLLKHLWSYVMHDLLST